MTKALFVWASTSAFGVQKWMPKQTGRSRKVLRRSGVAKCTARSAQSNSSAGGAFACFPSGLDQSILRPSYYLQKLATGYITHPCSGNESSPTPPTPVSPPVSVRWRARVRKSSRRRRHFAPPPPFPPPLLDPVRLLCSSPPASSAHPRRPPARGAARPVARRQLCSDPVAGSPLLRPRRRLLPCSDPVAGSPCSDPPTRRRLPLLRPRRRLPLFQPRPRLLLHRPRLDGSISFPSPAGDRSTSSRRVTVSRPPPSSSPSPTTPRSTAPTPPAVRRRRPRPPPCCTKHLQQQGEASLCVPISFVLKHIG